MRVLGISGSLRRDSFNTALLRAAAERLPGGVEFVAFERLAEIPAYDADLEEADDPGRGRRAARADARRRRRPRLHPRVQPARSRAR